MKSHPPGQACCLANDSPGNKCGKIGHWKHRCPGEAPKRPQQPNKGEKKGKGGGPPKKIMMLVQIKINTLMKLML